MPASLAHAARASLLHPGRMALLACSILASCWQLCSCLTGTATVWLDLMSRVRERLNNAADLIRQPCQMLLLVHHITRPEVAHRHYTAVH